MREPGSTSHPARSRAALVLGLIAGIEAVAIVFLVMTSTGEERASSALTSSPGSAPAAAAEHAFESRKTARPSHAPDGLAELPVARPASDVGPQPLSVLIPDTGAVGLILCGTVTASDGGPCRYAYVTIETADDEVSVDVNNGIFSVAGLQPGSCTVSCEAEGFQPRIEQVGLEASRQIERLDFVLERLPAIPVRIRTTDGRPLLELLDEGELPGNMRPVATLETPLRELDDSERPDQHWLRIGGIGGIGGLGEDDEEELRAGDWDGVLRLQVPLPVAVSLVWDRRVLETQPVTIAGGSASFTVDLETLHRELCTVRVRIVDAESALPLDGVLVELEGEDSRHRGGDATGVFVFNSMTPGSYRLHVHPPGAWLGIGTGSLMIGGTSDATHGEVNVTLETEAGQELDLGDLRLPRTVAVTGHVTDTGGPPLAVGVTATRLDADADSESHSSQVVAEVNGNDGSFTMRVVPGRWSFELKAGRQSPPAKIVDIHGDFEGLILIGPAPRVK